MQRKLSRQEFNEIKALVNNAINTFTKREASNYLTRLEFKCTTLDVGVSPNVHNMLSELVSYAKTASGRVEKKEHWVSATNSALYKLEMHGVE